MVAVTVMLEHSGRREWKHGPEPIATAMLRSILSGENAINVRNSIYNRMQLIYEQFKILQRELEALENSESEKNHEKEKDGKKSKRERR